MGWYRTRCYSGMEPIQTSLGIKYVIWSSTFFINHFAGVGIQNVVVLVNGKRINVAIGNTNIELITEAPVTGQPNKPCKWYG